MTPSQQVARTEMPSQDAPAIAALDRLSNEQIRYIASTEVVPKHLRGRPEAMLAVILKGRSLGLDDIQALDSIDFIDGKATLSGEAMVALVRSKGHSISWELVAGEKCTARGRRHDSGDEGSVTWTMAMAKEAGLAGRGAWKGYPDTMLTWRAVSQLCRFLFADVLRGVSYTPEEAEEVAERGRVTQAVTDLPVLEETTVRTEPMSGPSEAQLNRIAILEQRSGEAYRMVLRGVFGVEMASELDSSAAGQYEAMLEQAMPEDSAEEPSGDNSATDGNSEGTSSETGAAEAVDETGQSATEVESSSADDPEPVDEVVEGQAELVTDDLTQIAAETIIPVGDNRGKALSEAHDNWLAWAMRNTDRLPDAFVEALEIYVSERKPEVWEKVRP